MKIVRPGKEVTLRAIFRDNHGELVDPKKQEIAVVDDLGKRSWALSTPLRLDIGIYKVILIVPKDAEEGMYRLEWVAFIEGRRVTDVTDIEVSKTKRYEARLQVVLQAKDLTMTFLSKGLSITYGSERISIDNIDESASAIVISNARQILKDKKLNIPVFLNKFAQKQLAKEDYPFRRKIFWKQPFKVGELSIIPIPVEHSVKSPTSGLIFEANGRKIAYFPNVLSIPDKTLLQDIDAYVGDGFSLDRSLSKKLGEKRYGHASIRKQLNWLKSLEIKRAIFTNLGKWAENESITRKVFKQLSEEFGVSVAGAYEGHRIFVGRDIKLQRRLPGFLLKSPHAAHIAEGYKTIIVLDKPIPRQHIDRPIYFLQGSKVYGILKILKAYGPLPANDIRQMRDKHQITEKEWDEWWPDVEQMYYAEFKVEKLYVPPKDFQIPQGVERWITAVRLQRQSLDEMQLSAEFGTPFAIVQHSGEKLGRKVTLKELLGYFEKPIMISKGYITFMGGVANLGETEGDFDFIQREVEEVTTRDQPILFRIGRALPPDLAKRLRRRYIGEYGHVFTSHVPLYDLVLIPSTDKRLIQMQRVSALRDPKGRSEAAKSLKEDTVIPMRFIAPLKGYKGYYKFPELAASSIAESFAENDYPLYSQKKYDGVIVVWMKQGNKVIARSDSGFDVTRRFPKLVAIAKRTWPDTVTLISETELWIAGEHQPRELMAGYLSSHSTPDDSNVVSNIFDIVYLYDEKVQHHELPGDIGDIHSKPYEVRYNYLKLIDFTQSTNGKPKVGQFNLTPSILIKSSEEIQSVLEKTAKLEASEGSVIKSSKGIYELDGLTRKQVKWKRMAEIHAIVVGKIETRTPNVFNLELGVRIPAGWKVPKGKLREVSNKSYIYIGKSFNVATPVKVGDVITLTFHTLNHYKRDTGEQFITVYEPKFIEVRKAQRTPDSAEEAIRIAKEKELLTVKRLQKFPMDDKSHRATCQVHYRGKSAHMDFRVRIDNSLLGPTMFIEKPGEIKEDVTTLKQAKEIESNWKKYFKLQDIPQTEVVDPRRKIQVTWKKPEPVDWLGVQGVVEKGEVGATKHEFGVFSIVDRPTVYLGAQKPYFKEFFIEGKVMSGRWVIRYLPNPWEKRPAFVFLMWKPEDQTPYVLTKRAVKKRWIPPPNISALPPLIRKNIPERFKYWLRKDNTERLATREELVKALGKGEVHIRGVKLQRPPDIKEPVTGQAVLQHRWFRGQFVRRGGPTEEYWDLRVETDKDKPYMHFILASNPHVVQTGIAATYRTSRVHKWMDVRGIMELRPGTKLNPTIATPAFLQTIDSGTAQILESGHKQVKLRLNMKKMKGNWMINRVNRQNLFTLSKEEK